ncbi:hypothetical protein SAVIM338S_00351 [Streptomyces avidinii]
MLQYRNLGWSGIAWILAVVTPTHLSAATYGVIGSGRKALTPRLVADFAVPPGTRARVPMPIAPTRSGRARAVGRREWPSFGAPDGPCVG